MENQNSSPTLWTKKDTASYLRCSIKTVERLTKDGRINGFKIGRKVLIYPDSVTEQNINAIKPKFL
jgi:excisionase family DNA binding protein